jgi:hypothetical protein
LSAKLLPALAGSAGFQKATMLSWISSLVGISISCTAPLPKPASGSTQSVGRFSYCTPSR